MSKWTFANVKEIRDELYPTTPSLDDLYRKSLCTSEGKKIILQNALNAALENLMSWERVAKAWGFDVEVCTDTGLGKPQPEFDGNTIKFMQAYGVIVREHSEGGAE